VVDEKPYEVGAYALEARVWFTTGVMACGDIVRMAGYALFSQIIT
jgi:hypothetical protein